MFIQVIQGHISDKEELKAALDRWTDQIAPGAIGWLGSTAGVTDDGIAIALARFESEDAARRNSDRHEQHQWWMETSKLFSGDVTFHDCTETFTYGKGGSDDAGFVQVMQGRLTGDVERLRQQSESFDATMSQHRPDVIGGVTALHGDGNYTDCVYFTSEREAREGEKKEMPPEVAADFEEMMSLVADVTYYDIKEPWLSSPR
jgi:hypothetical protein